MATIVKFTINTVTSYPNLYLCNQRGNATGEYITLRDYNLDIGLLRKEHDELKADYRHDLANVQQELIAAQEEIRRLREALESIAYANLTTQSNDIWVDEAQMIIIAQKALK